MKIHTESDLYLYFYESILDESKTLDEINFIESHCIFSNNDLLLDMPCFFGRHAIKIASNYPLVGVIAIDINYQYLLRAQNLSIHNKLNNIRFIQADMRKIAFCRKFRCALSMYTSFGYFSEYENYNVLLNYFNSLDKNGTFIIDIINPTIFKPGEFTFAKKDNDMIIDKVSQGKEPGFWDIKRNYIVDGKSTDFTYQLRLYTTHELYKILTDVGFKKIQFFGDFDNSEYQKDSKRIIAVATSS